ncbi:HAD-IA family hydrolase [Candidatus Parcubacteria bacterium]|nr:HAD-IA family hydrolase [Patescibacteria group bacterium]MCG2689339.1 HAD-IA family hydrolase [Candidatus Parcubacteria bacterium]
MIKGVVLDWLGTLSPGILEGYFPKNIIKDKFNFSDEQITLCETQLASFIPPFQPKNIEEQREILLSQYQSVAQNLPTKDQENFVEFLMDWSFEKITPTLYPDALSTLEQLTDRKFSIALLTNGWPTRLSEVQRCGVANFFNTILISNVAGVAKPDPKAYQNVSDALKLPFEELLFVDDKEKYLAPAQTLGMQVILMDRDGTKTQSSYPTIKNISEVASFLEK